MDTADQGSPPSQASVTPSPSELLRGSVWNFRYLDTDDPKPVVIVSNDGRNRSRFEWVHVVRITSRPKRSLPTIVELTEGDAPLTGRAMVDRVGAGLSPAPPTPPYVRVRIRRFVRHLGGGASDG